MKEEKAVRELPAHGMMDQSLPAWSSALSAVDDHSAATDRLNQALAEGFFALSREKSYGYTAMLRLSSCLFDARDTVKASLRVDRRQDGSLSVIDSMSDTGTRTGADAGDAGAKVVRSQQDGVDASEVQPAEGLRRRKRGSIRETSVSGSSSKSVSNENSGPPVPRKPLRHTLHAMPSEALREAAMHFERAVAESVAVANAASFARQRLALVNEDDSMASTKAQISSDQESVTPGE